MTFWNDLKILFIPAMFCLEDAMKKFTECSASKMEGNIASWQQISASWDASSFLDKQDFCSSKTLGVKILPFSVPFFLANTICKQLHGSIYVYQSSINETFMDTSLNTTAFDGKLFWTGYTDAEESGKFVSLDGALNFDSIPGLQWKWGQPTTSVHATDAQEAKAVRVIRARLTIRGFKDVEKDDVGRYSGTTETSRVRIRLPQMGHVRHGHQ